MSSRPSLANEPVSLDQGGTARWLQYENRVTACELAAVDRVALEGHLSVVGRVPADECGLVVHPQDTVGDKAILHIEYESYLPTRWRALQSNSHASRVIFSMDLAQFAYWAARNVPP